MPGASSYTWKRLSHSMAAASQSMVLTPCGKALNYQQFTFQIDLSTFLGMLEG